MTKSIEVNKKDLEYGLGVIQEISSFRPYSSISFQLSEKVISAVSETKQLAKWGMGKNRSKMKRTVSKILGSITNCSPGDPVNLNLTEYEHKSIMALENVLRRALDNNKDGVALS